MINRKFHEIEKDDLTEDSLSVWADWDLLKAPLWNDLLKSQRVLIVAEAGAGKTHECIQQKKLLSEQGHAAFHLELSSLSNTELPQMLSPDEVRQFNAWKDTQSDIATFFLDSYDELKLSQGSFEQALKRLARAIDGYLHRVRIIVTTRPISIDKRLIQQYLPIQELQTIEETTDDHFAEVAIGNISNRKSKPKDGPKAFITVALLPLSTENIRHIAEKQGIQDASDFIADIQQRQAMDFARRPQDLIELCAAWLSGARIKTYRDQVENNIEIKLKPSAIRNEPTPLSDERALDGAQRLALATLLSRRFTIRQSANADIKDSPQPAIDPSKLLKQWNAAEIETLLTRGLFSFATYGRVRFHHRSVWEYLSAERLSIHILKHSGIAAVKRLLFALTAQGEFVVKPAMRPVVAWLAISHTSIFETVRDAEPELLFNHGDPGSLSDVQRYQVLTSLAKKYSSGGWRGLSIPSIQIQRFASKSLKGSIEAIWANRIENPEMKRIVLRLIAAASLDECAHIPYQVAFNPKEAISERIEAIETLIALNDRRLPQLVSRMAKNRAWPDTLVRSAIVRLYPKNLSTNDLLFFLDKLNDATEDFSEMRLELPSTLSSIASSKDSLEELRTGLTTIILKKSSWSNDWPNSTTTKPHLLPLLAAICKRLVDINELSFEVAKSVALIMKHQQRGYHHEDEITALKKTLEHLGDDFRESIFWAADAYNESLKQASSGWNRYIALAIYGPFDLNPVIDAVWIKKALADRTKSILERTVALEVLFRFWDGTGDRKDYLEQFRLLITDSDELLELLHGAHNPPPPSRELVKAERDHKRLVEQDRRKREERLFGWTNFKDQITRNPVDAFSSNKRFNTIWNLWKFARKGQISYASGNDAVAFVKKYFNNDVADRFGAALRNYWREDKPTLRSERADAEKNTYSTKWELGLAGLYIEANDSSWANRISSDEAGLACRYVLIELNQFPPWLKDLAKAHPRPVESIIGGELMHELAEGIKGPWHSKVLRDAKYTESAVAELFIPRLLLWLRDTKGFPKAKLTDGNADRLSIVIDIILNKGDEDARHVVLNLASSELISSRHEAFAQIWLATLLQLNPSAGIDHFERILLKYSGPNKKASAEKLFAVVFGGRGKSGIALSHPDFTPNRLLRLVLLAYKFIKHSDDRRHSGVYTPNARDDAEDARNALLNALIAAKGPEAWNSKQILIASPFVRHFKDRLIELAKETSAEEADAILYDEATIAKIEKNSEAAPATYGELYQLLIDRLNDVDDSLKEDESPREAWAQIQQEKLLRRELARKLKDISNGSYKVVQESVTGEEKERDIEIRSTANDLMATIEIKIGEKDRSALELKNAIRVQLVNKYMRAQNSRVGCLLISLASKTKGWRHPRTKKVLNFEQLISYLDVEAQKVAANFPGAIKLIVKGLDLRPPFKSSKLGTRGRRVAKSKKINKVRR